MFAVVGIDNVGDECLDIAESALLCAHEVAIAHKCELLTVDAHHAVDDILAVICPGEHHLTFADCPRAS
jgi:hypothetical protein